MKRAHIARATAAAFLAATTLGAVPAPVESGVKHLRGAGEEITVRGSRSDESIFERAAREKREREIRDREIRDREIRDRDAWERDRDRRGHAWGTDEAWHDAREARKAEKKRIKEIRKAEMKAERDYRKAEMKRDKEYRKLQKKRSKQMRESGRFWRPDTR